MMFLKPSKFIAITLLAGVVSTNAIPFQPFQHIQSRAEFEKDAKVLHHIAHTSLTCRFAEFPAECATNYEAAPYISDAMFKYHIRNRYEMAAILALIAFESGEFKYNTNHFPAPGRPGQGTRAMLMPNFVLSYAQSIPELSASLAATDPNDLNAVLALVLPDKYSWASAFWFLTTQCASIRPGLQNRGQAGFEAYLACVGADATGEELEDRLEYWARANFALGIGS